jgi:predicted phosphodiesterase
MWGKTMTRLLFFTDCHFRHRTPLNRTDDILETALGKMEYILKFAKENKCILICGGDFWQTPSQPDFVAARVAELFEKYNLTTYFLIGNHDCIGGNIDSYKDNKLGLFQHYSWFKFLVTNPIETEDVIVEGCDFSRELECPEHIPCKDIKTKKIRIVVVHSMITDDSGVIVDGKSKTINWCSIQTAADIVMTGHYHPGFEVKQNPLGTYFVNPGAMVRLEASKIEINRIPKFAVIEIELDRISKIKIDLVEIPHRNNVFDIDLKNKLNSSEEEKQKFFDALDSLKDEEIMSGNILSILEKFNIKKLPEDMRLIITQKIIERCMDKVRQLSEER